MTPTSGKRKRKDQLTESDAITGQSPNDEVIVTLQALFRQHFETSFEPLEVAKTLQAKGNTAANDISSDDIISGWSGLSEEDDEASQITYHSHPRSSRADIPREELKTFMTAKPPSALQKRATTAKRKQPNPIDHDEATTDSANLKKDLALQRLLKESHLLDPQSSLSHTGQNRHKVLDLRLQDMGSKSSIFKQEKMPLAQRKGILAKAADREDSRRRTAQENGIILERAFKGKGKDDGKRQRGIGAPSVGKFQGGMLKLSKKDVAEIEGPKKTSRGRK